MRFVGLAALAALSLGLYGAAPAQAAWECIGAEYVCGSAPAVAKKKASYKKAAKHRAHKAERVASSERRAAKRTASKKRAVNRSVASTGAYYSGGGSNGIASYYWQGQRTASGARFNPGGMTAAHRTLPFGTRVLVTNRRNGRSVTVTINDRGPFIKGRIIDLSRGAASVIGMTGAGLAPVSIQVLGRG